MTRPKSYEWEYGMSHGKNQPIIERSDANSGFPWKNKRDEIRSSRNFVEKQANKLHVQCCYLQS